MVDIQAPESSREGQSVVSKPINRMRWATRRMTVKRSAAKRQSLKDRFHRRNGSAEKGQNGEDQGQEADSSSTSDPKDENEESEGPGRRIFFNTPLPDDARDEEGHPIAHFARNKIRTAKYTPLSFVPKNLWLQFHNVANVFFLFIAILGVRGSLVRSHGAYGS
jgi:phospholipid-translocating ATPase